MRRLALCLLAFVLSCQEEKCLEEQEAAVIKASWYGFDDRYFDSLVVRSSNAVFVSNGLGDISIGSKSDNVKFPAKANVQFFLHGFLLKDIAFEMRDYSALTFYNGKECEVIPDSMSNSLGEIHRWEREGVFYRDVRDAKGYGTFIDSSRSGTLCWIAEKMNKYDEEYFRCAKWE